MTLRRRVYLVIMCLITFVLGFLSDYPNLTQPTPLSLPSPTSTYSGATLSPSHSPTSTVILEHQFSSAPKPKIVPTPTYVLPEVKDNQFQRALVRRTQYQTYRFTTISRFSAGGQTVPLASNALNSVWVEGEYEQGNLHQVVYHEGTVLVESVMVGDVVYNRIQAEPWIATSLSAAETTTYRLDPFMMLLGGETQIKSLGPDPLPQISSPTTRYEITISSEGAGAFVAQALMGGEVDMPASSLAGLLTGPQTMFVWLGRDDHLYRVDLYLHLQLPAVDGNSTALDEIMVEVSTRYYDFDDPTIHVEPPRM